MRTPDLLMSQSRGIAFVVMVLWVSFDLQHIPELFQNNTPSLPCQWRIRTCCALIYILLCMLHFFFFLGGGNHRVVLPFLLTSVYLDGVKYWLMSCRVIAVWIVLVFVDDIDDLGYHHNNLTRGTGTLCNPSPFHNFCAEFVWKGIKT